jgi:ribonuclease R
MQLSATERRADAATYDVVNWLKCEYMQDKIGEEYAGIVTAVTNFGLFVELTDIYVEGLIHVTALTNDYYHFDAASQTLTGERSGLSFRLGAAVRVSVSRVDVDERKIDLQLLEAPGASKGPGRALPKRVKATGKTQGKASAKGQDKDGPKHPNKAPSRRRRGK